jgi:hypothetical protein
MLDVERVVNNQIPQKSTVMKPPKTTCRRTKEEVKTHTGLQHQQRRRRQK